jgi:membrane dipeptidase
LAAAGIILDISHMAEESFWQALDLWDGPVIASHSNSRDLVHERMADRHLSDAMIKALVERDAVIGTVFYNAFIAAEYQKDDPKDRYGLDRLVRHIDRVCQIAGSARHAALGSDLDGGLGSEHIARELDSCADMPRLAEALGAAGYSDADVAAIMGDNWIRLLEGALPEA